MTTHTRPPANWPSTLPYLPTPLISSSLSPSQLALIHPTTTPSDTEVYTINTAVTFSPTSNSLIRITPITDPSHPACGQSGLFAAKDLPAGSHIIDYTGLLHSCPLPPPNEGAESCCASSDYDLAFLDRDAAIAIDGSVMGNEARFVNDWRGVREQGPNAMFEEYWVKVKDGKGKEGWVARMGVWVCPAAGSSQGKKGGGKGGANGEGRKAGGKGGEGGIRKGEEICVSYGRGWWRARMGLMEQSAEYEGDEGQQLDEQKDY